jgi:hypothetical protein
VGELFDGGANTTSLPRRYSVEMLRVCCRRICALSTSFQRAMLVESWLGKLDFSATAFVQRAQTAKLANLFVCKSFAQGIREF